MLLRFRIASLIAIFFTCSFAANALIAQQSGTIIAKVIAFRNSDGQIQLSLYDKAKGFPNDRSIIMLTRQLEITNSSVMEVKFENVPFGTYAIAGHHDENFSGDMEYNWIGMPLEGYCFSNDARPILSPPSFAKAKFTLNTPKKVIYIAMQY